MSTGLAKRPLRHRLRWTTLLCGFALLGAAPLQAARIENQAFARYQDVLAARELQSNIVAVEAVRRPPRIRFFTDATFTREAHVTGIGKELFLEGHADGCNADPLTRETTTILLKSLTSGDQEVYRVVETEPNSGTFRAEEHTTTVNQTRDSSWRAQSKASFEANPEDADALIESEPDDIVSATIDNCGFGSAESTILIDPAGFVFDSETNAAMSGVLVQLIDVTGDGNGGHPGGPAVVYADDERTPAPAAMFTNEAGMFSFPLVAPSLYRLVVTAPDAYMTSRKDPARLPAGRRINLPGSFGGDFPVNASTDAVFLDLPLDPLPHGLSVQKTVAQPTATLTETVLYTVVVRNVSTTDLDGVTVTDRLPAGFRYVAGTTRLEGVTANDPQGATDVNLAFALGTLAMGESRTLTYRALIGPGALQGDGINRASAASQSPVRTFSNVAAAKVEVEPGVFDDRAFILGKVFGDCDADSLKSDAEPGLAGVRLYLEDGTYATTDAQGNYSFYGISPRTHVLKIDSLTLPAGLRLKALQHRQSEAGLLFIDAKRGELVRADFATSECPAAVTNVTAAGGNELERSLKRELETTPAPVTDARALPASGILDTQPKAALPKVSQPPASSVSLEQLASTLTNEPGFVTLQEGMRVGSRIATIQVKGLAGAELALSVNGAEVPASRVGTKVTNASAKVMALEYVGIELVPGGNQLVLVQKDGFGNIRATVAIAVFAPGDLDRIVIRGPAERAIADGSTLVPVTVTLEDTLGTPVDLRVPVTLETTAGEWQAADLNSIEPGIQTFLEAGASTLLLRAPDAAADAELRIVSGQLESKATIAFLPALRPMLGVGVVEGTLSFNNLSLKALSPARRDDGFDEELASFTGGRGNDQLGSRAALFLKGKVRGDYLLTLGFDSQKDTQERLFRDIDPDRYYPVYGDAATKGFDAQSTGRLYVRVDREKSYLLAGDFTTQSVDPARNLGAYQRSLNGLKEHYEAGGVTANVFASRDTTRQIIDELPANGTSGPFELSRSDVVVNSEFVEIVTRDRNQPELIVSAVPATRLADYEIDAFTGRLVLRAPVPSLDADLNPVSIRVTYEVDQGGEDFWLSGADARFVVNERLTLGASIAEDANPIDPLSMQSVNATVKLATATTAIAELARTDRDALGTGLGERLEIRHEGEALKARLYAGATEADFLNRSATLGSGRREAGFKSTFAMDGRTRLIADAIRTESVTTDTTRAGGLVGIERRLGETSKMEIGLRQVRDRGTTPDAATNTTSARIKGTTPVPGVERASMFGEYEQDLGDQDRRLAAVGGDYRLENSRLYARHELISSLTGPYDLDGAVRRNATVIGIDTRYREHNQVFSEYRVGNSLSTREAEAAIGLRNRWTLAEGLRANTSLEKVDTMSGSGTTESTAVAGSVEYTRNPLWKGTARLELRRTDASDTVFSTLGWAWQFADDWAVLAKNVVAVTDYADRADRLQERFRIGVAYRDNRTNRLNGLARYEFRRETGLDLGSARSVHMLSAHANYQVDADTVITGQYAASYALETVTGQQLRGHAQLVAGRITRDIGSRWDAGLAVRNLFSGEFATNQFGIGIEAGYLVMDNLWLSAGYNITGFHDRDLSADEYTREGAYLRLRFKFDESILERL